MEKANMELRCAAWTMGIPLWAVAEEMGISTETMYRWLRKPLEEKRREKFEVAMQKLAEARN